MTGNTIGRNIDTEALYIFGGMPGQHGGRVDIYGADHDTFSGNVSLKADNSNSYSQLVMYPGKEPTYYINGTCKTLAMQEDVVPRRGGAVITGSDLARTSDASTFTIYGGTGWGNGALINLFGKNFRQDYNSLTQAGVVLLRADTGSEAKEMCLTPSGTWTWAGQAVQLVSDQRLKQQISEIDDKLLDAWEDVDLVQFKYNDAVDQKGDTARLHTGYVVQQIDEACKSHNLDISKYGLYCHEEYPERTEEVTTENEDGTTSKETKVIEPAREYYSLRYTEVYAVECKYLRREVSRLKQQNEDLEQRLKMLENK